MEKESILCLFIISCISFSSAIYSDCGSEISNVTSLLITNCESTDPRCTLHRNTNVSIQISFIANQDIEQVKAVVHGIILGVPIPFDLPNPDGCKDSGLSCPLKSGGTYSYATTLPILNKYPRVTVDIKFELQDQGSTDITCSTIPARIQ